MIIATGIGAFVFQIAFKSNIRTQCNNSFHLFLVSSINLSRSQWSHGLRHRLNTGIVGSNPTQGMDIYMRLFCVYVGLHVGSGLATG
jgi:hypothetical protein